MVCIGINLDTSLKALELAKKHPMIVPTIGIHPGETQDMSHLDTIKKYAQTGLFKAIGEIGLDYYKMYAEKELQIQVFKAQLEIADELKLPVVIHNRHADEDILAILKDFPTIKAVLHCFSSGPDFVHKALEVNKNTHFSFTGMITYSKKGKTIQSIKEIPLNRIMLETDAPYLTPKKYQGKENEPSYLIEIAEKVAMIKDRSAEDIITNTTQNATVFFRL